MTASRTELERLTPDDIERYLRTSGGRPVGALNGRATSWALEPDELEVIVPVSSRFRDYPSPFARRALVKLREMLLSTQAAAAEADEIADLSLFTERVEQGISTTLCRALARLGRHRS